MSTTPRTDAVLYSAESHVPTMHMEMTMLARQLETALAALQKRYDDDVAELNARLIQRREDYAAHSVKQAHEMQALRVKLEQSQARETEYRKELEKAINGLQEWCDDVDRDSSWDGWDSNFKRWKWGGIKELEQALSQPAPPVVPIADVTPLMDAGRKVIETNSDGGDITEAYHILDAAMYDFNRKHPGI